MPSIVISVIDYCYKISLAFYGCTSNIGMYLICTYSDLFLYRLSKFGKKKKTKKLGRS